jgi:hypothetical protein
VQFWVVIGEFPSVDVLIARSRRELGQGLRTRPEAFDDCKWPVAPRAHPGSHPRMGKNKPAEPQWPGGDDLRPEVVRRFKRLRQEMAWIKILFDHQKQLQQHWPILCEVAQLFFRDLNVLVQLYWPLEVGRVTDPAMTGKMENLTISMIEDGLKRLGALTPSLTEVSGRLHGYRDLVAPARDKVGAHNDLRTLMEDVAQPGHTDEQFHSFIADLQAWHAGVAEALGIQPEDHSGDMNLPASYFVEGRHVAEKPGDVTALVTALKPFLQLRAMASRRGLAHYSDLDDADIVRALKPWRHQGERGMAGADGL